MTTQQKDRFGNPIKAGDPVKFYDVQRANQDRDYSGDPEYYSVGMILKIYEYKSKFGYSDIVCDIQVGDRVSNSHFITGVELIK